eukprot:TRINITY_DN23820_c0_g1_i1.p1 TRINITY_DN23820_c0_g1~~TRINITY_DN23820_c0_g1_i1.p1  ORF type:complete len:299 (-),score=103.32 TRINITY_DN23820_c0_g1_i1:376-1272(-)
MVDVKMRIKEGCRGGREQFTWNSIKEQDFKDRECYLGQSAKVGTMGKFGKYYVHDWYARKRDTADSISEERSSVQAYEEELMQEALGLKPKKLLLAKQQMSEAELQAFLKDKKENNGRAAMGPQKKIVTNDVGEQVATSNEDFIAEHFRDGQIRGLGFASHRDAKLEKIKAATLGTAGELKGSKLEPMKLEVKAELKQEVKQEEDAGSIAADLKDEVKEEPDVPSSKRRRSDEDQPDSKGGKKAKKDKKLKKAEKKLRKMEKKAAKKEKKAAKQAKLLARAAEEARRRKSSSSSSDSS